MQFKWGSIGVLLGAQKTVFTDFPICPPKIYQVEFSMTHTLDHMTQTTHSRAVAVTATQFGKEI
jgi:hypothetical protein